MLQVTPTPTLAERRAALWVKNVRHFMDAGQMHKAYKAARHAVRNLDKAGADTSSLVPMLAFIEAQLNH